ncbi:hypothetical protein LTR97_010915 [Elasticomyces elasticus]|uniref:Uncharacterized protein n=1 Tax=Elasticomyces elasticus TaxID=574655 RepID=A0AAN7VXY3_9PEZI|nr:hypothetical protein LTR97_010915 [Elasticomyces elasticus]
MIDYAEQQRGVALELITALVFRQDERVSDLCRERIAYSAFLSPDRLPALDDLADSPAMRMKQLMGTDIDRAAHGWSPISHTTLDELLDSRLRNYGTSTMCQQRIIGIMQRENVCAIRFREVNRTGALDKMSVIRVRFSGAKVEAIDEFVDQRKSYGFERALTAGGTIIVPQTPTRSSPESYFLSGGCKPIQPETVGWRFKHESVRHQLPVDAKKPNGQTTDFASLTPFEEIIGNNFDGAKVKEVGGDEDEASRGMR